MSQGAYVNKPERRIKQLRDVIASQPRVFDAAVIGAGKLEFHEDVQRFRAWHGSRLTWLPAENLFRPRSILCRSGWPGHSSKSCFEWAESACY